ncbi:DUF2306 domain-containing protein [Alicyclobacillus fastidiosus]|uniref:DUF2306 domain-containing protein n=1 Tax=Alicyclobacillus fastidiosus TaxID=392011 RepID=A0ABV5AKW7_9BACL|nr:DUF2306 domain-containing protein [Alicyclobacillus fastidiosus]WEH10196.1 DUF2306 domain-containing protein [Alicyclobacillus fastidiosus]
MYRWFLGGVGVLATVWVIHVVLTTFVFDPTGAHILAHKHLPSQFHHTMWAVVLGLHVVCSSIAMICGILGFLRRLFPRLQTIHRANGRIYIVSVLIAALSAGYLAPFATGGEWTSLGFNVLEAAWVLTTVMAYLRIRRKSTERHVAWMIRSYSLAYVNTAVHIWLVILHGAFSIPYDRAYTLSVWFAGAAVLLIAEGIVRRGPLRRHG